MLPVHFEFCSMQHISYLHGGSVIHASSNDIERAPAGVGSTHELRSYRRGDDRIVYRTVVLCSGREALVSDFCLHSFASTPHPPPCASIVPSSLREMPERKKTKKTTIGGEIILNFGNGFTKPGSPSTLPIAGARRFGALDYTHSCLTVAWCCRCIAAS